MARLGLFVPSATYSRLMQGYRVCRKCGSYFKKHHMTYVENVGLVCSTCFPKINEAVPKQVDSIHHSPSE